MDEAGLAHLAVVHDVYPDLSLFAYRLKNYLLEKLFPFSFRKGLVEEMGRPGQATCMRSKDAVCAALQKSSPRIYLHRIVIYSNYLTTLAESAPVPRLFVLFATLSILPYACALGAALSYQTGRDIIRS
jgi:hypothetical protein